MSEILSEPYLYILARTDLPGATNGKRAAQISHASNQAINDGRNLSLEDEDVDRGIALEALINEWEGWNGQTSRGFGTAIVLSVDGVEMDRKVAAAQKVGLLAGITHDPSYPVGVTKREDVLSWGWLTWEIAYATGFMALNMPLLAGFFAIFPVLRMITDIVRGEPDTRFRTIPIDTAAYVFGRKDDVAPILGDLKLLS